MISMSLLAGRSTLCLWYMHVVKQLIYGDVDSAAKLSEIKIIFGLERNYTIGKDRYFLKNERYPFVLACNGPIGTVSANSVESDLGCTSRVYFDNVTLTSQKPCQHNINCDCSETNGNDTQQ